MAQLLVEQFIRARRAGAPLIAIRTPDIESTIKSIALNRENEKAPMMMQDCVRGLRALNKPYGEQAVTRLLQLAKARDGAVLANPTEMLVQAHHLEENGILFIVNLHRHFHDAQVVQGIWNLRDPFKVNTRTLVMLSPDFDLPAEIVNDVLMLNEPLPEAAQLEKIVLQTYEAASIKAPDKDTLSKSVDALVGLASFPAEQVCAMEISKDGMNIPRLWERKRQQVETTQGLKVWRGTQRFSDIGGNDNIKEFLLRVRDGKRRPRVIVWQDELEKQFAGASSDSSGTTQELLGTQLSFMADNDSTGVLLIGHPGVAKSEIAKAFGNELGVPTIQLTLGDAKGSLVGESNTNMRNILKVIEAVSQGRALWIATCNDIQSLPGPLIDRYTYGTFFFDLPNVAEREVIWQIYVEKLGLPDKHRPADTGWNGRNIRNCCMLADDQKISLVEAAKSIVPIGKSEGERITALRRLADGRYISAAKPEVYKAPTDMEPEPEMQVVAMAVMSNKRKIKTDEEPPTGGGKKQFTN